MPELYAKRDAMLNLENQKKANLHTSQSIKLFADHSITIKEVNSCFQSFGQKQKSSLSKGSLSVDKT